MNSKKYYFDARKIGFVLLYMMGGPAKAWKQAFLKEYYSTDGNGKPFPSFTVFEELLTKAFDLATRKWEAQAQLQNLQQGADMVDYYINRFCVLTGQAEINEVATLIEYFMEGLKPALLKKVFSMSLVPNTIEEWYDIASRFDAQYQQLQEF